MLTELHIKDTHFDGPIRLSRLNLVTGNNNTGKTTLLNYVEFVSTIDKEYLNDSIMKEVPNASYLPNKPLHIGKVCKPKYLTTFLESFNLKYTFAGYSGGNIIEAKYSKSKQELNISTLCEVPFVIPVIDIIDNGFHPNSLIKHIEYMLPPTGSLIIIVEQPETGYDRETQFDIGMTLTNLVEVNDRVQVIIESHSECLLSGVRLAMRDSNLTYEDVRINHLAKEDNATTSIPIDIRTDGDIGTWPDGFFDEMDIFLKEMVGF